MIKILKNHINYILNLPFELYLEGKTGSLVKVWYDTKEFNIMHDPKKHHFLKYVTWTYFGTDFGLLKDTPYKEVTEEYINDIFERRPAEKSFREPY